MSEEAHAQITVSVAATGNLGVFEVMSEPTAGSEVSKFTPGGQAEEVVIGGRKTREDITVNRVWLNPRDRDVIALLDDARGSSVKGAMRISRQPLDADYNPKGAPMVWNGVLMECTPPPADSESSDPARLQLVMSTQKFAA
jgi:hypothetical protein